MRPNYYADLVNIALTCADNRKQYHPSHGAYNNQRHLRHAGWSVQSTNCD